MFVENLSVKDTLLDEKSSGILRLEASDNYFVDYVIPIYYRYRGRC